MSALRTSAASAVRHAVAALCCVLWPASPLLAQGGWTGVVTDLSGPDAYGEPVVGLDAEGNGFAVWNNRDGIQATRYTRASGTWSSPQLLSADDSAVLRLRVHAGGNAILTWQVIDDNDFAVGAWAALYDADTETWSQRIEFSADATQVDGVIDSQGNATVAWVDYIGEDAVFKTATYDRVAASWSVAPQIRVNGFIFPIILALDHNDRAVVMAQTSDRVTHVAHFSPSTGSWSQPVTLAGQGESNIAGDRSGNFTVVWTRLDGAMQRVQASHYSASTGTWSAPASLAISAPAGQRILAPAVASDAAGNTTAVWEWFDGLRWTLQSATYSASSNSWAAAPGGVPVDSNAPFPSPSLPRIRIDVFGNATVVWSNPSVYSVEAARRTPDGSWSRFTLAPSTAFFPRMAVDPAGNVTVVWVLSNGTVQSTRWVARAPAPTITQVTPSDGTLTLVATAPPSPPWFANTNYEYSLDDGATWTTRSPASTAFPLVLDGLLNGATYHLRLRGVNSAGVGAPSAAIPAVPGLGAPANLNASIVGNTVTLHWSASGSVVPTSYVLEGGLAPGEVLASVPVQGPAQAFTFPAPTARFYVRLYATVGGVRSLASNEILITVPPPARAFLWAMVVDDFGRCIEGAIVEVVAGQGIGQRKAQETPCDAWSDGGVLFTDLTAGVPMTLRSSAPGYGAQEKTVIPSSGPFTVVLLGVSQLQGASDLFNGNVGVNPGITGAQVTLRWNPGVDAPASCHCAEPTSTSGGR